MPRKRNPSLAQAFGLARFGAEAWMVMGMRAAKIAAGGPAAMLEAQRMVVEKSAAAMEAQFAAALALATGATHHAAGKKALAGYRRRVSANRRRLMRKG